MSLRQTEQEQIDLITSMTMNINMDDVDRPVETTNDFVDLHDMDDPNSPILGQTMKKSDNNNQNNNNNNSNDNNNQGFLTKCFKIEYYQAYFDIDTKSELNRIRKALVPFGYNNKFIDDDINEKPDLYGPFWIITTLAFLMAAMGNLAKFFSNNPDTKWDGDIKKITTAATVFYSIGVIIPFIIYCILINSNKNNSNNNNNNNNNNEYESYTPPTLITLLSLYGYSLAPFVPACILCVIPSDLFDWITVFIAFILSTIFLIKNIYNDIPSELTKQGTSLKILLIILICQFGISLGLKLYFFKY